MVGITNDPPQLFGQRDQTQVTDRVTIRIIDLLEMIDIYHQDCPVANVSSVRGGIQKGAAVGETCQHICTGKMRQVPP